MEKRGSFEVYTFEEVKDEMFGPIGTPNRDEYEAEVAEALHAYRIGEAVREARQKQNITQEELGARLGVSRTQVSRIEKGCNASIAILSRVFKALGVGASLNVVGVGEVALW